MQLFCHIDDSKPLRVIKIIAHIHIIRQKGRKNTSLWAKLERVGVAYHLIKSWMTHLGGSS